MTIYWHAVETNEKNENPLAVWNKTNEKLNSPQFLSRGRKSFQKAHEVAAGPRPYLSALMSSSPSALNV